MHLSFSVNRASVVRLSHFSSFKKSGRLKSAIDLLVFYPTYSQGEFSLFSFFVVTVA